MSECQKLEGDTNSKATTVGCTKVWAMRKKTFKRCFADAWIVSSLKEGLNNQALNSCTGMRNCLGPVSVKEREVGHVDQVRYRALSLCRALWWKYEHKVKMAATEIWAMVIELVSVRSPVAAVVRGPVQALGRAVPAAGAVVHWRGQAGSGGGCDIYHALILCLKGETLRGRADYILDHTCSRSHKVKAYSEDRDAPE